MHVGATDSVIDFGSLVVQAESGQRISMVLDRPSSAIRRPFHSGDNGATIFIGTKDLLAFLDGLGVEYRTIDV